MATYVIGDIHGCFNALQRLLHTINFQAQQDRLWLVGDLINNGPQSLEVLRWAKTLEGRVVAVLGNHDLHLLAVAYGARRLRSKDTFEDILHAPDRLELITWLRHRPLVHHQDGYVLVHAGILPPWSLQAAMHQAREVQKVLQSEDVGAFLENMYGDEPRRWADVQDPFGAMRLTVNAMTRMRTVGPHGDLDFKFKGELSDVPDGLTPWFRVPNRTLNPAYTVLFGHWSALGVHHENQTWGLDSGCVWGRKLTALRLDDQKLFEVGAMP